MLCLHGYVIADEIQINSMNSSGLYVEELASLRTYYTDWKLVTYINLTIYDGEYDKLKEMINTTENICERLNEKMLLYSSWRSGCHQSLEQINNLMNEIEEYHSKWFISPNISRTKRGLINPIGDVAKYLFGVLSNEDAEYYLAEFQQLHHQNNLQNSLIKEQTTLVESVVNLIKQNEAKYNEKLYYIEQTVKSFIENSVLDLTTLRTYANEMFNHVTMALIHFMNSQKIYLNAISLRQNNMNNPNIIPPKLFYNELKKIHAQITAKELDLPLPITYSNLALFYQISTVESVLIKNQLIISFTLPLVNTKKYILYKSTSLPTRIKNNLFNFITPHHEFVALDHVKDKYIPITNEELKQCSQITDIDLICKETFPIMSAIGTKICEINLLRMDKVSDECNNRITNISTELWIKLRQPNSYIFVFPSKQFVYIACPLKNYDQFLEGTGIIRMEPGCSIKTYNLILHAFQTITTVNYRSFTPVVLMDTNITQIVEQISLIKDFEIPNIVYPNIVNYGEQETLDSISFSINKIKQMEKQIIYKLAPADLKDNIKGLFTIIVIISIVILVVYLKYFYKKGMKLRTRRLKAQCFDETDQQQSHATITINNSQRPPSPLPRQQNHTAELVTIN